MPLLIVAGLVVVVVVLVRRPFTRIAGTLSESPRRRTAALLATAVGAAVLALILFNGLFRLRLPLFDHGYPLPLALIGITLLAAFGWKVMRGTGPDDGRDRMWGVVLSALLLGGSMWLVALYAQDVGERQGAEFAAGLEGRPGVVLYSVDRLSIQGPGVISQDLVQDGNLYHHRYAGLRMLIRASDRYFLVPVDWRKGQDSVFVVNADDSVRVDLVSAR
ncbi:hypothetical protein ACFYVR_22535 [Rhodococcus sp. NPDC003318]|uniref:hypothetical protein n=1 Tax=Rhodococcus sp. NPDC003318 TaxID=3364503 RepID=UPI0036885836